ncbi:MAG: hypothetical protein Q8Q81_01355 [Oxalobacteraceae bacterium]|nr:hypothetical protein [Oxalobacteraceae bacterium]
MSDRLSKSAASAGKGENRDGSKFGLRYSWHSTGNTQSPGYRGQPEGAGKLQFSGSECVIALSHDIDILFDVKSKLRIYMVFTKQIIARDTKSELLGNNVLLHSVLVCVPVLAPPFSAAFMPTSHP